MQPYQQASRERQRHEQLPMEVLKEGASVATRALPYAAGGAIFERALPFLSKYIPEDLAIKGLSKIDPRFGKFINKAMQAGETFDDVKGHIQEKVEEGLEKTKAKENRNIIEQYSPELHNFILKEIQGGRSPLEAGAIADIEGKHGSGFKKVIAKIVKDHKTPWSSILQTVYGGGEKAQPNQPQDQSNPQQQQSGQGVDPQLAQIMTGLRGSIQQLRGSRG